MDEDRFVVLELPDPNGTANQQRDDGVVPGCFQKSLDGVAELPRLSITSLSPKDRESMERAPQFSVAPVMPTALIRPMKRETADDGESRGWSPSASMPRQDTGAADAWGLEAVGARRDPEIDGRDVTVAVLDTGVDLSHAVFRGVEPETRNFTYSGTGTEREDVTDRQGHGTHCAGTIVGRDVDGRRIGIAPGVTKLLVGKVLKDDGSGGSEMLFSALQWATSLQANVISMSLGFDFPGMVSKMVAGGWPADLATSQALEAYRANLRVFDQLMALSTAMGIFGTAPIVIAAAGNESRRDVNARYRIAKSLPAAANEVLSVAAVGPGEPHDVAGFSNCGADISAPGVDIVSAAAGSVDGLMALSGTSMAGPHVAGVAALWYQKLRREDAFDVRNKVISHIRLDARPDVFAAGFNAMDFGSGLVRAPSIDSHDTKAAEIRPEPY